MTATLKKVGCLACARPVRTYAAFFVTAVALLFSSASRADNWDVTGFVAADVRAFWLDAQYPNQSNSVNVSAIVQPEFYWRSDDESQRVSIVGFARADSLDSERSHVDLREAYWGLEGDDWDVNVGVNKMFWGVAESRHLVDIINQVDVVEDIDQEDKLGQPMLNFNLQREYGRFGIFLMPLFRERTFPGAQSRLRLPLPVDSDNPIYESSDGKRHLDVALRYSHYIGDVDIGVHFFDGTSREPGFVIAPTSNVLLPVYEQMTQVGVDLQYTNEAWLWKLEAISRDASSDSFFATVGGFEYSFYGVRGGGADIGVLIEYQYDGRSAAAPLTVSDNDLFVATRLAMNDASDTSVLAGFSVDLDTRAFFVNVEAERRFGDTLSAEIRLRAFLNSGPSDLLSAFRQDDYVQLRLSWYY